MTGELDSIFEDLEHLRWKDRRALEEMALDSVKCYWFLNAMAVTEPIDERPIIPRHGSMVPWRPW